MPFPHSSSFRSRRVLSFAVSSVALLLGASLAAPRVYVAYPSMGHTVAFDRVILEGSVTPGATLRVNGLAVPTGPDGLFITWFPLARGVNDLKLEAFLAGERTVHTLRVTSAPPLPSRPTRLTEGSVTPTGSVRWYVNGTDPSSRAFRVAFQGSAGGRATARIGSAQADLREVSPGRYAGSVPLSPAERHVNTPVRVSLRGPDGRTVTAIGAKITSMTAPGVAVVQAEDIGAGVNAFTRAALDVPSAQGEPVLFFKTGTRFSVTGEVGVYARVTLGPGTHAFVPKELVKMQAPGTPAPGARVGDATVTDEGDATVVRLPVTDSVPYHVQQDTSGNVRLRIFTATLGAGAAVTPGAGVAQDVTLAPAPGGTVEAVVRVGVTQPWGYTVRYDGGALVVRVKHAPVLDAVNPMLGRRIVLDAGHGGKERGGAGSLGVWEKDLVLPIVLRAAAKLRELGADVILTRDADVTVPLYDRALLAEVVQADVLVSVHANALPDGQDPAKYRGAGVYTYQPQALPLAQHLLNAVLQGVPEAGLDRTGHFHRNLALTRPSTQPSVLVELAYLTDAGNLRLLMGEAGQERFAEALARGIASFFAAQASR